MKNTIQKSTAQEKYNKGDHSTWNTIKDNTAQGNTIQDNAAQGNTIQQATALGINPKLYFLGIGEMLHNLT